MDYSRPVLADRLAAEYALGTLRGAARRRFESLLLAHPALRDALQAWQARLAPLSDVLAPVEPPPRVWQALQTRLFAGSEAASRPGFWQRLALWRGVSAFASAAALGLFVVASRTPAPEAPIVVVLAENPETVQALKASFVLSVTRDGRAMVLKPVGPLAVTADRALELWAVPPSGAPRSLGLVDAAGTTTVIRAQLLRDTAAFAVSMEPAGGSPTGAPTGPIVSVGKLQT